MAKRIVILLFMLNLGLIPLSVIKAQDTIADSLHKILNREDLQDTTKIQAIYGLARASASEHQNAAINLAEEMLKISKKGNYTYRLGRANYIKYLLHYYSKRFTKAIQFAEKNNQIAGLQSIYKIEKK